MHGIPTYYDVKRPDLRINNYQTRRIKIGGSCDILIMIYYPQPFLNIISK